MPFWGSQPLFFSAPYLFKSEWVSVGVSEVMSGRGRQWKFGGKHRAWVERKHTRETYWEEKVTRPLSKRSMETVRLCSTLKSLLNQQGESFKHRKNPPMRNNYYPFNRTNILGIQSHLISGEDSGSVLGTECFPHLVPLMEMSTQTPLFSWHI